MFTIHLTPSKRATLGAMLASAGLGAMMLGLGHTESTINTLATVQIGEQAPDFTLTDIDGKKHTLADYTAKGQTVVLEWFSPMCPFVKKHYRDDTGTMLNIQKDLNGESIVWLRINSANANHPAADVDLNKETAQKWGITTPILFDNDGSIGRAYGAKRTPEMYIINSDGILAYHGAIDNKPDAAAPGEVNYVRNALTQVLAGETVTKSTTKAYGCSIKY